MQLQFLRLFPLKQLNTDGYLQVTHQFLGVAPFSVLPNSPNKFIFKVKLNGQLKSMKELVEFQTLITSLVNISKTFTGNEIQTQL